ncbi:MAG: protein translocase subunit SecD [Elusimicrobiota bacterium]
MQRQKWRLFLIALVLGFSIWNLYPTIKWYTMTADERNSLERFKDEISTRVIKLGLDLRGGMNLILELDVDKLRKDIKLEDALAQAIEIIRNRVDQFGVAEPHIAMQGDRWITVQLPGVKDPDRAVELIGKTALLEFRLVDEEHSPRDFMNEEGDIDAEKVPKGFVVLPGKEDRYYVVEDRSDVTGSFLTNAEVKVGGDYGAPYVALDFNKEGAVRFADLTERNVDRKLAIVLDGIVQSAPVIRSRIPDGHAIIEGNFTPEEAKSLSIILRAGALPAPVRIIENRTVGPTLGADSVRRGTTAGILGLLIVLVFMIIYYKWSGLLANFALLLNMIILMGMMAYFHATLTLPGIAGIILTIGMAVDANVLIFERIREEMRAGKTIRIAIDAGYDKAFSTILDSNITTLIAAAFLFQFGTGPIKGFAVTLSIGILSSMFTSIIVTKVVYELVLKNPKIKKLSI